MRLTLLLMLVAGPVLASGPDEWEKFRTDVETACSALAPQGGETAIEVNPFGSESYGAALLITSHPDGAADRYVCIYDKARGTAELTAPFTPPQELVVPSASPSGNVTPETTTTTAAHPVKP
ncbi:MULTISPECIES: hypothetical protein [unclassified Paracoccus (in: a-proteobacteria)]|uniref:hypothetical protein n=1 Tax=unclassified Paracoccus (in: a-proteobacteria) TaxID=2688777 RepID=UPI0012B193BD|nr:MULTISPECIES: hypothetical protein [unclassified Paracoccus (in: a-proteobacteria)]UXU73968.1 hypothetical protein GB879_008525 [Paracoccus sp. SMMA_5]UXU79855.1 hypothetical protein GB880_008505 [Paracoccus sp. SMMA_5_TC]